MLGMPILIYGNSNGEWRFNRDVFTQGQAAIFRKDQIKDHPWTKPLPLIGLGGAHSDD